jgi:hypothetical protein
MLESIMSSHWLQLSKCSVRDKLTQRLEYERLLCMQKGDNVLFARYAGTKLQVGGEEHVVMGESDVLGTKGASFEDLKPLEVCDSCLC